MLISSLKLSPKFWESGKPMDGKEKERNEGKKGEWNVEAPLNF